MAMLYWMMPGTDGVEICHCFGAAGGEPYTYILLLTSRSDLAVEALEVGPDDYLTKSCNSSELRARLRAGRRIVEP
jgi:DNA-binding response OmpR family regulator